MQVLSVLGPPPTLLTSVCLLAGVAAWSASACSTGRAALRACLGYWGAMLGPVFPPLSRCLTVSPNSPAIWSRSTALLPTSRRFTSRWHRLPFGRSDRERDRFMRTGFRIAIERGDLNFAVLGHAWMCHKAFSSAERTTRRSVARVGDGAGLRREAKYGRRGPHDSKSTTAYRDHAGPDRHLLHLQRRAVREATFERS